MCVCVSVDLKKQPSWSDGVGVRVGGGVLDAPWRGLETEGSFPWQHKSTAGLLCVFRQHTQRLQRLGVAGLLVYVTTLFTVITG